MRSEVQLLPGPPLSVVGSDGALAQLGERLLCKHQVIGSIPIGSTRPSPVRAMSLNGEEYSRDEDNSFRRFRPAARQWRIFDIVNGFFNRCRDDAAS